MTSHRFSASIITAMLALLLLGCATQAQTDAPPTARELLRPLERAAIDEILAASRSSDPIMRANAIEAMLPMPDRVLPLAQLGMDDDAPVVRFTALVTIGRLKLNALGESAARRMNDESAPVRAAAMFAARACGRETDLSEMARMLRSPDPRLRANVAMLLGQLGDRSAVPMLEDLARAPMPRADAVRQAIVRIQIAEALIELGHDESLNALRAGAYSQFDEVRVLAVQTMGKVGDRRMLEGLKAMLDNPPVQLQLAAAEALARLNADSARGRKIMLEAAEAEFAPVRAQAAFSLGLVNHPTAATGLAKLQQDPEQAVRLAAAGAILRGLHARP